MNKKGLNIGLLILGFILILVSIFFLSDESLKTLSGICLGVGTGLLGLSTSSLILQNWYYKHPLELKQSKIDIKDERNISIRNKAKAKSADIIQWFIMGIAWITIIANFQIWITLLLVAVFLLKNVLELYFTYKYDKEM